MGQRFRTIAAVVRISSGFPQGRARGGSRDAGATLDGQHYLTAPEQKQLDATVQRLSETYADIYSTNWPFRYSEDDLDRLSEIRETLQSISKRVRSYNDEFVEQELERYAHLVTDVDEAGHNLNEDQQKAIVRDDEYN